MEAQIIDFEKVKEAHALSLFKTSQTNRINALGEGAAISLPTLRGNEATYGVSLNDSNVVVESWNFRIATQDILMRVGFFGVKLDDVDPKDFDHTETTQSAYDPSLRLTVTRHAYYDTVHANAHIYREAPLIQPANVMMPNKIIQFHKRGA